MKAAAIETIAWKLALVFWQRSAISQSASVICIGIADPSCEHRLFTNHNPFDPGNPLSMSHFLRTA